MGLGARLVVKFSGEGALCVEDPFYVIQVIHWNVHLCLEHVCAGGGGGNVTFHV